jgi:hypothetical protein
VKRHDRSDDEEDEPLGASLRRSPSHRRHRGYWTVTAVPLAVTISMLEFWPTVS